MTYTLAPHSSIAVWFVKFNILADSFRGIFLHAFSRQTTISLRIVSQRMSKSFSCRLERYLLLQRS